MKSASILFLTVFTCILFISCKKHTDNLNCSNLNEGIRSNNAEMVKSVIESFINKLPSKNYSKQNLESLATNLSSDCNISAEVICFDCIDTLPSLSEIRIRINTISTPTKIIDISYTSGNAMTFHAMHD